MALMEQLLWLSISRTDTYTPNADYNGTDTFSYTITQGDKTSSADVTVTIEAVNDAPSIDIASTIQVAENQTAVQLFQSQM
jgi:VCBS repeat-containing protein